MTVTTTPTFNAQYFNALIDQIWNGDLGESAFVTESLALGIPMERIQMVLNDIRAQDGLLTAVES